MKKIVLLFLLHSLIACKSSFKTMMKGEITTSERVSKIPIDMIGKLPFVKVEINGKIYNFMFDTGAMCAVSSQLFQELQLPIKGKMPITDSQRNKKEEIITLLPELKLGTIKFKNFGVAVIDFDEFEFKCTKIDGIIGANQMAKLFWKINYREKVIEATDNLSNFEREAYTTEWDFITTKQKTPILVSKFYHQKIGFLLDTGANAYIDISKEFVDKAKDSIQSKIITREGYNSIGIYGENKIANTQYQLKPSQFEIANQSFKDELISTGSFNLIGNDYLEHFSFILDWKNNKVYLKELEKPQPLLWFPFSARYIGSQYVVTSIYKTENQPLKLNDAIISINGQKIVDLSEKELCDLILNYKSETIKIEILRNNQILPFEFSRENYFR